MKSFKNICTQCGACCKSAGKIPNFPEEMINDTGGCIYLDNENKCMVFENRPTLCNVDKMYELLKDNFKSKNDYIKANIKACNVLITGLKLDPKYLIKE